MVSQWALGVNYSEGEKIINWYTHNILKFNAKLKRFFAIHVEMFQWLSVSQEFQFLFRYSYVGTDTQFTVSHEDLFLLFG